jgi:predicted nucleic acid-binding protein
MRRRMCNKQVHRRDQGTEEKCNEGNRVRSHSVLALGEIQQGIERLRRRDPDQAQRLEQRMTLVRDRFADRVLPISPAVAERWGLINVPDALPVIDGLLAATALEHGLTLVTRNLRDVERSGAVLLNPFTDAIGP